MVRLAPQVIRCFGMVKSIPFIFLLVSFPLITGCDWRPGVKIGEEPPGLACTDIKGDAVSLSQFKGKVVVLYFWSGTCCGDAVKQLEPFYGKNRFRGMEILAVNVGETKQAVESYAADNALTFTVAIDEHSTASWLYGVSGVPTIFIIDRSGIVREKILGDVQTSKLGDLISKYI